MPIFLSVNESIKIRVFFREGEPGSSDGGIVVPDNVEVLIFKDEESPPFVSGTATHENDNSFTFNWTPDEIGSYRVDFIGTFSDEDTVIISQDFIVELESPYTNKLEDDQELVFATDASPLYVDPDFVLAYFSEATALDAMELIHKFSLEVEKIFKGKEIPLVAYEYIEAAVLCALSRIYDDALGGQETSFTLGQLQVTDRRYSQGPLTRGSASNWCELAAALRIEMRRLGSGTIKGVVRGSRLPNPMPERHLKDYYHTSGGRRKGV